VISNGGEEIVNVKNNTIIELMATVSSQLGIHSLIITLTDFNLMSTSETIMLHVINDPPVFQFGPP
jgi:hypothetical protein